jgi:hypothetical protein
VRVQLPGDEKLPRHVAAIAQIVDLLIGPQNVLEADDLKQRRQQRRVLVGDGNARGLTEEALVDKQSAVCILTLQVEVAGLIGRDAEPIVGLAYVSVESGSFRERGGAQASLRGGGMSQNVGYTTLGLRAMKTMMWGSMQVIPHVESAWLDAFNDLTPNASVTFATTGIGFCIDGVSLAEDSAVLDAGVDFSLCERPTTGAYYTDQYADSVPDNAVKGGLTWLFNKV